MSQKSLANWLKTMIVGVGICGLIICIFVLPVLVTWEELIIENDKLRSAWLVLLWLTSLPCFAALVYAWKIVTNIGNDRSFTADNAKMLKNISVMAFADVIFLFIWNIVLLILKSNPPAAFVSCMFIDFAGVVIAVVFAALAHLVKKAVDLQEQSDLTI